jgi:hypothetical protein
VFFFGQVLRTVIANESVLGWIEFDGSLELPIDVFAHEIEVTTGPTVQRMPVVSCLAPGRSFVRSALLLWI